MNSVLKRLDKFEEYILAFLLPFMCILVFVAVFFRYTKLLALPWTEELARYCMIWIIFLGISVAAKKGEHFCVTAVTMLLTPKMAKFVSILRILILLAFNIFVSKYCIVIMENQMMMEQKTPTLKLPMWVMYFAIFAGSILMSVRYVWHGIQEIRRIGSRGAI